MERFTTSFASISLCNRINRRATSTEDGGVFGSSDDLGIKLSDVQLADLGRAHKVTIDKDSTTIINGVGKWADIEGRVKTLQSQMMRAASDYDREKLQERVAQLAGGVAVIKVGAATGTELKERKARAEGAISATRAALEEGIGPGGGLALFHCIGALEELETHDDEALGVRIVKRALEEPMRQPAAFRRL